LKRGKKVKRKEKRMQDLCGLLSIIITRVGGIKGEKHKKGKREQGKIILSFIPSEGEGGGKMGRKKKKGKNGRQFSSFAYVPTFRLPRSRGKDVKGERKKRKEWRASRLFAPSACTK